MFSFLFPSHFNRQAAIIRAKKSKLNHCSHVLFFSQGMYSCCNFEDETSPGGNQGTLPLYHHVPPPPPPQFISTGVANTSMAMATQQQQQQKHHQQQQPQPPPVYSSLIHGSPPATVHSGMALGPSNSPILGAPMPCSTFLPRHDRRLAVVDRWTRPKAGPEKSIGVGGGITELSQFPQGMAPHWAGGERSLDEYKRYYGPIDPEGLGASAEPQTAIAQTPKTTQRGTKSAVNPRVLPKVQPPKLALHGSPQRPASLWRKSSLSKRKDSGGPLYENILPLGRRGGGRNGLREGGGRRGRRPPPIPLPVPVPLSSPTQTPPSPSPSLCYTTSASTTSSTSSSSSSDSLSRSNSPSSSTYTSSQSFRYRGGAVRDIYGDFDTDELTEESSLLLGRRKGRSRMSSRSLPCSPPPPPIPPRKPRQPRENGRDRTGTQLAQLQEWWASWGEKERGRRTVTREDREEKRHHKERERERRRRKKGRKKKKREEREREQERKRRKAKKKKKKEEKRREKERRPEQDEGIIDRKEEYEKRMSQDYSYPGLRRSSFRKKSESSSRSYDRDITRDELRHERIDERGDDGNDGRGRERQRSPLSHEARQRALVKRYPSSSKPSTAVKFWGSGNPKHAPSSSSLLPLLPLSSKRRKSVGSEKEGKGRGVESRPLLGRNGRSRARSREGISLHEWDSDEEDEEDASEVDRGRGENHGRRREGRGMESESDRSREREKTIEIYTDDEGSSGEFGKFERYWEGHEERAVGGIGGGGWFFGTYPAREKGSSINSRDDSFVGLGPGEGNWGLGSSSRQWPPPTLTPPPPRRYWSVDKLPVKSEKKVKNRSQDNSKGHTACSCHSPHHMGKSHSKWSRVTSRSQEDLHPHCQSSSSTRPKHQTPKPDRSQGQANTGSQLNLSVQRPQRSDRNRQPSPPQALITPLMAPSLPALPPPPSSSHPIHVPPPTSSSSVSSPSVVSSTPGAPQPSSMSSSSAKLQYQRLRSVPQRFQSPHPPLKTKSLCSRRGSAHFSSVESEV